MSVTLYEMEHSPFCIPVSQALTALGVEFESVAVSNWNRSTVIEATGGTYYQVPVIRHGDAIVTESTPDSQDIARYVDRTFAGGRLFPAENTGLQEILIRYIENDIEIVTFKLVDSRYIPSFEDPVARMMITRHKERRFGPGCVDAWQRDRESLRAKAEAVLFRFESVLRHSPYILGETPFYVDFSLFGVVGNYLYRDFNSLPEDFTGMRNWLDRLASFRYPAMENQ